MSYLPRAIGLAAVELDDVDDERMTIDRGEEGRKKKTRHSDGGGWGGMPFAVRHRRTTNDERRTTNDERHVPIRPTLRRGTRCDAPPTPPPPRPGRAAHAGGGFAVSRGRRRRTIDRTSEGSFCPRGGGGWYEDDPPYDPPPTNDDDGSMESTRNVPRHATGNDRRRRRRRGEEPGGKLVVEPPRRGGAKERSTRKSTAIGVHGKGSDTRTLIDKYYYLAMACFLGSNARPVADPYDDTTDGRRDGRRECIRTYIRPSRATTGGDALVRKVENVGGRAGGRAGGNITPGPNLDGRFVLTWNPSLRTPIIRNPPNSGAFVGGGDGGWTNSPDPVRRGRDDVAHISLSHRDGRPPRPGGRRDAVSITGSIVAGAVPCYPGGVTFLPMRITDRRGGGGLGRNKKWSTAHHRTSFPAVGGRRYDVAPPPPSPMHDARGIPSTGTSRGGDPWRRRMPVEGNSGGGVEIFSRNRGLPAIVLTVNSREKSRHAPFALPSPNSRRAGVSIRSRSSDSWTCAADDDGERERQTPFPLTSPCDTVGLRIAASVRGRVSMREEGPYTGTTSRDPPQSPPFSRAVSDHTDLALSHRD
ncbi:hypothetical protein ACHAXA_009497 [Cyclostephanos tholiformis]|uniref:Uncharacterized protein n=1 Tax=Cyclostephanos tholiformis TaxID=382380 RepID=A0ABD3RFT5_9STRA